VAGGVTRHGSRLWAAWSLPGIMTVENELTVEDDVPEVAEIAAY
jgi:hypothetical protein